MKWSRRKVVAVGLTCNWASWKLTFRKFTICVIFRIKFNFLFSLSHGVVYMQIYFILRAIFLSFHKWSHMWTIKRKNVSTAMKRTIYLNIFDTSANETWKLLSTNKLQFIRKIHKIHSFYTDQKTEHLGIKKNF